MNEPTRHKTLDYTLMAWHIGFLIFALFFAVWVIWQVAAKPNAKLFQEDNMVCYSQPYAIECHPHTK